MIRSKDLAAAGGGRAVVVSGQAAVKQVVRLGQPTSPNACASASTLATDGPDVDLSAQIDPAFRPASGLVPAARTAPDSTGGPAV
ncbi:hypothetical protein [Frankia sp. Cr1]|uniref:hypothetical protein n=1 Tax=Frankia sp. Cr1 TaxID=3073931 RepID=UPI002AD3029C|nr:hypothetical protein [Frankia sp. Cr1]